MGNIIRSKISSTVQDTTYYSILADETKDLSKKEQLSIVLRYVDVQTGTIYERFLSYIHAESLTAASLSSYIQSILKESGLDSKGLVSQGYDGASVMAGKNTGVQQRMKEVAPQAIYVHCHAHCLNLVLVDCAKSVPDADEFFQLLHLLCFHLHLQGP